METVGTWPQNLENKTPTSVSMAVGPQAERSHEAGYRQSHPYGYMFTGLDLKKDELSQSNNYMRLIFGGKPDDEKDGIHRAYNHAIRQVAESPVQADSVLGHLNPAAFVPGGEATKDSLLDTFAEQRRYYKGAVDTDAERALKSRPTHKLIHTTHYGKNLGQNGSSGRYNHVRGQNHLLHRPKNLGNFMPQENISSKTYAPNGEGGENVLNHGVAFGADPRAVNITGGEGRIDGGDPIREFKFTDTGMYAGNEIDRYSFELNASADLMGLFENSKTRVY